jgi:hypothetical protein
MSELSDQKLFSARRSNCRPPNQPTATTITSKRAGQTPASAEASLLESLPNQIAAAIGAIPSAKPGTTTRRVKATTSLGRLISASRLPASDKSEWRLELDASSSISPPRGSMAGLKQLLRTCASGSPVSGRISLTVLGACVNAVRGLHWVRHSRRSEPHSGIKARLNAPPAFPFPRVAPSRMHRRTGCPHRGVPKEAA